LYLCFDRPCTAISIYKLCHETLTVQDKTYRLPLQFFIHKQKSDYSIAKITPLDLHLLQVSKGCPSVCRFFVQFSCNAEGQDAKDILYVVVFMLVWND
jgi:hypothetical protein